MDLYEEVRDIQDILEAGVAEKSRLVLVGLGLSRTAAVEVGQFLPDANMSVEAVAQWLRTRNAFTLQSLAGVDSGS